MPFRDIENSLRDIDSAIAHIEEFTSGMDFEAFREDPKTVAAVERKLLVISEAAIRMGREAEERFSEIPWRDVRGIGNWLRHQYERVELPVLWAAVCDDLPPYKGGCGARVAWRVNSPRSVRRRDRSRYLAGR